MRHRLHRIFVRDSRIIKVSAVARTDADVFQRLAFWADIAVLFGHVGELVDAIEIRRPIRIFFHPDVRCKPRWLRRGGDPTRSAWPTHHPFSGEAQHRTRQRAGPTAMGSRADLLMVVESVPAAARSLREAGGHSRSISILGMRSNLPVLPASRLGGELNLTLPAMH